MTTRPHGETRCENGYKNFTEKLVDESVPEHKDSRREFFSWISFRAARKSGIEQAQYLHSLPQGP